jgi:predicted DNA-binding transcriptional regulator AlpA
MTTFLRFRDLKARGIVNNRVTLTNRINKLGFPPGRLIGANTRAWTEAEVEAWLANRPTEPKPAPAALKHHQGRPRKADHAEVEA